MYDLNFFASQSDYGASRTRTFANIFPEVSIFKETFNNNGIPPKLKEENVNTLYYLLYSYYGNSSIASSDENRFIYNLMSLIFQFGPTWEKRLEIQDAIQQLDLTQEDWLEGAKLILNTSLNPSVGPNTDTSEFLDTINQQNVSKQKRGKLEGYAMLMNLLETDVTGQFLARFKPLFRTFVSPQRPLLYETEEENQ